jgi:hypothetical protein
LLIGNSSNSGEQLQVTGTAKITGVATFNSTINALKGDFGSAFTSTNVLQAFAPSATDANLFQVGMVGVSNGFSVQRVSSNLTYVFNDGNVGIGTTSPNARLHVINSGAVWNGVFGGFWGAGGVALGVQSGNTPSIQGFADITQTNLGAFTNLSLNPSGGNVLIGTTTTPTPVSGVAFPLTVSSSAATRIRIDSTQATPNSGVGLYANGVQKFSFAMFGTDSDFTIYNDALLASALLVKGTNSNVLIGTTTDVGAKLYVNGAFRTGTLTAGTQTAAVDWRLGNARGGAATNNALIRVEINGVLVDLLGNYV